MTGLKLAFTKLNGWILDPTTLVEDFDTTIQCVLVDITTVRGTHRIFPLGGTNLLRQGALGLIIDLPSATHECNFASAESSEFINDQTADTTLQIDQFSMQPVTLAGGKLELELRLVSTSGVTSGQLIST